MKDAVLAHGPGHDRLGLILQQVGHRRARLAVLRIGQETHPDLSLAYSHQPAISEPSNIVSVLHGMLDEDAGPSPVDGLKSPVDLVISELRSQGIIK